MLVVDHSHLCYCLLLRLNVLTGKLSEKPGWAWECRDMVIEGLLMEAVIDGM